MALSAEQRVSRRTRGFLPSDLAPEEYFVLSRIEGPMTVAEVIASSGLPRGEGERILDRLLAIGAVELADGSARAVPPAGPRLRDRALERKKELLRAQLAARTGTTSDAKPTPERPASAPEPAPAEDVGASYEPFELPLPATDDPRLDRQLAIGLEDQRWVLALADGQESWTPFEFLGLRPTDDPRAIKRAFHVTSRRLHPDAYYGRNLGRYGPLLAELFQRAKFYYAELRKAEVRAPYVAQAERERLERRRAAMAQAERARQREEATKALRQAQQEAERAMRRQERLQQRAARERDRLKKRMDDEARDHLQAGEAAERQGKLAKAANFYRLALRADPQNEGLRRRWEDVLAQARKQRGTEAFTQATRYLDLGHTKEAMPLFVEAARAYPTLEHLAYAADAVRESDPALAREFALAALDALTREEAQAAEKAEPKRDATSSRRRPTGELVSMRVMMGRAFLAAGQKETAKQQALAAKDQRPEDPEVRALLKSLKVK